MWSGLRFVKCFTLDTDAQVWIAFCLVCMLRFFFVLGCLYVMPCEPFGCFIICGFVFGILFGFEVLLVLRGIFRVGY